MARISEIHYRDTLAAGPTGVKEFIEIALAPGENPADYQIAYYYSDGVYAGSYSLANYPAARVVFDADANEYIYEVNSDDTGFRLTGNDVGAVSGNTTNTTDAYALVDTSTGTPQVLEFYDLVTDPVDFVNEPGGIVTAVGGPADGLTATVVDPGDGQSLQWNQPNPGVAVSQNLTQGDTGIICFAKGMMIKTGDGERAVETLKAGDLVMTKDNGLQPIAWIGSTKVKAAELDANEKLRPIRIHAGALGNALPQSDLLVTHQHRVLVSSKIAQRMFGSPEVLIAAVKLLPIPGVNIEAVSDDVEYFHILFDEHQIIFANGMASESLFTGATALEMMSEEAREEILTLFPEIEAADYQPTPAAFIPHTSMQRKFVERALEKGNFQAN